jgi:crossover junction endodeoxyribonuclease RusA
MSRIAVEVHYAPRDSRRDAINLAATTKPVEDGLVDARVVPDDTAEWVVPTHGVIDPPTRGAGRVYVIVREVLPS